MMKNVTKYVITSIVVLLVLYTYNVVRTNNSLREELSISKANEKAYSLELNDANSKNLAYQFNIEQLNYLNDSLINKMNTLRKDLKIKDDEIKQMQYMLSEFNKKDTIIFKDTIFVDKNMNKDTIIRKDWYVLGLNLKYPNIINTNLMVVSEKIVFINSKRETIDPPKKCAISRWFQKKHTVIEVEVVESNPYIKSKDKRFIKIIE